MRFDARAASFHVIERPLLTETCHFLDAIPREEGVSCAGDIVKPRLLVFAVVSLSPAAALGDAPWVPAPADQVPYYAASLLPCAMEKQKADSPTRPRMRCAHGELESKTLRELSIMRNTIYARYGWDGYRKAWLGSYFHAQKWFKANPKFGYKLVPELDRKNAHLIGQREQSLTSENLKRMRRDLFARHGKVWNDRPSWKLKNGKGVSACTMPTDAEFAQVATDRDSVADMVDGSNDCHYAKQGWYKANPRFTDDQLTAEDRIEMGLIDRSLGVRGGVYSDSDEHWKKRGEDDSLDKLLGLKELRELSLRDLRLLRNTIYARRGRRFKSEELQGHFDGMSWYAAREDYSDKRLTKNDVRNIQLIKSVENEFGGPLSDEDWLIEPEADGA